MRPRAAAVLALLADLAVAATIGGSWAASAATAEAAGADVEAVLVPRRGPAEGKLRKGRRHGSWVVRYASGTSIQELTYRDGQRHGPYVSRFESGRIRAEGAFRNGKRHGRWTVRRGDGSLVERGTYRDGEKHGPWVELRGSRWEGRYERGEREGEWTTVDEQGRRWLVETYRAGRRHGPTIRTHADGARDEEMWVEGERNGLERTFGPDGKLRERATYVHGERNGTVESWWPDDNRRDVAEYRNGKRHGLEQHFGAPGHPSTEQQWVDGVLEGPTRTFYGSGRPWTEGTHHAGRLDGPFTEWDETGRVARSGRFRNGRMVGTWRIWVGTGYRDVDEGDAADVSDAGSPPAPVPGPPEPETSPPAPVPRPSEGEVTVVVDAMGWRTARGPMVDGMRHGLWRTIDAASGAVVGECTYVEDELEGSCRVLSGGKVVEETEWFHGWRHGRHRATSRPAGARSPRVEEGWHADDLREGPWTITHDGSRQEGAYHAGKREGTWRFTSRPGASTEETYRAGRKHGPAATREGGVLRSTGEYADGKKHGEWVELGPGGERVSEGRYRGGEKEGAWIEREARGTVAEGTYRAGERHGGWVLRLRSGGREEGTYVGGRKSGTWTTFGADGTKAEESVFRGGKRNGRSRRWSTGELVEDGRYVNDERHGRFVLRSPVQAEEGSFEAGVRTGRWVERDRGGRRTAEGTYAAGRKEGVWTTFDAAGSVARKQTFERGVPVATWEATGAPGADELSAYLPLPGVRGQIRDGRVLADDDGNRLLLWRGDDPRGLHARVLGRDRNVLGATVLTSESPGAVRAIVWPGQGWVVAVETAAGVSLHRVTGDAGRPWGDAGIRVPGSATAASIVQDSPRTVLVLWYKRGAHNRDNRYRAQRIDAAGRWLWSEPVVAGEAVTVHMGWPAAAVLQPGPGGAVRAHLSAGVSSDMGSHVTRYIVLIHPDGRIEPDATP